VDISSVLFHFFYRRKYLFAYITGSPLLALLLSTCQIIGQDHKIDRNSPHCGRFNISRRYSFIGFTIAKQKVASFGDNHFRRHYEINHVLSASNYLLIRKTNSAIPLPFLPAFLLKQFEGTTSLCSSNNISRKIQMFSRFHPFPWHVRLQF
jgi:hypothetical protein